MTNSAIVIQGIVLSTTFPHYREEIPLRTYTRHTSKNRHGQVRLCSSGYHASYTIINTHRPKTHSLHDTPRGVLEILRRLQQPGLNVPVIHTLTQRFRRRQRRERKPLRQRGSRLLTGRRRFR